MIEEVFKKKDECSGCTACKNVCPVSAIDMVMDDKGFKYPKINHDKCIQCGLCVKTCPFSKEKFDKMKNTLKECYAIKHKDLDVRNNSTSGGMFTAISDYVLKNKGIVYGVGFDSDMKVIHKRVTDKKGRDSLRKSKYVQSDLDLNIFFQLKKDLEEERLVLFTGTPCQVAGLRSFLKKDYNNLILCDIICHGVMAPGMWKDHVDLIEKKYKNKLVDYEFRCKKYGWKSHVENIILNNKEDSISVFSQRYPKLFQNNLCLRDSCYNCHYSNVDRVSDLTIGDFWKGEEKYKNFFDNKGVSILLINSKKGLDIFDKLKDNLDCLKADIKYGLQHNLQQPTKINPNSVNFYNIYKNKGYKKALYKHTFPGKKVLLKRILSYIKFWEKKTKW